MIQKEPQPPKPIPMAMCLVRPESVNVDSLSRGMVMQIGDMLYTLAGWRQMSTVEDFPGNVELMLTPHPSPEFR